MLLKTFTWTKSLVVALIRGPGNIPLMVITCMFFTQLSNHYIINVQY
jgi:hypothetical protein